MYNEFLIHLEIKYMKRKQCRSTDKLSDIFFEDFPLDALTLIAFICWIGYCYFYGSGIV